MQVSVNIVANASKAIEALGVVRDRTTDLERGLNKLKTSLNTFGSLSTKAITVPITAGATALGLATKEAIKFNKSMSEVSTLLKEVSQEDFVELKKRTLEFSTEIGIAADEVVPALYQAISAGVDKENVFTFLETAGKASIAGVTTLETSVDGLTSVVNAYGSDVMSVGEASDLMFTTVRLGKTNFEELSKSLYNVIPTASSLGVSFNDVSAALATITMQGTPTSVATTQLRQALVELSKEGSTTDKIFRDLAGKSFTEFIASGGNLQQALQLLEQNAQKTGSSISASFSSVEAGNAVLQLTGKSADTFSKSLEEMATSANATNVAFGKMDLSEAREFEKIKVQIQNLVIELGQKLMPIVRDDLLPLFKDTLIPVAQKIVETIGELATTFNNLPPSIKNASFQFLGLVAIIGPAALAIVQMGNAFNTTRDAISGAKDVIKIAKSAFEGTKVALIAKNVALKASAIAWRALNLAINATPVGIMLTLVTLFAAVTVAAYNKERADKKLREEAIKTADAVKVQANALISLNKETEILTDRYTTLSEKAKLTSEEQEEHAEIVERLKELYPKLSVVYDDNGNVISNLVKDIDTLRQAKRSETLETIKNTKAELANVIAKQQSKVNTLKNRPINVFSKTEASGFNEANLKKQEGILDGLNAKLQEQIDVEAKLNSEIEITTQNRNKNNTATAKATKLTKDNTDANNGNSKPPSNTSKNNTPPDKGFNDYILDLEAELLINDRKIEQLKEINKNYDDTSALQNRNAIITSAITQMATELELTEQQALKLGDTYGEAFDTEKLILKAS